MIGPRVLRAVRRRLNAWGLPVGLLTTRRPANEQLELWPRRSPYENTRQLFQALQGVAPTRLYHLTEAVSPKVESEDWVLGHPFFPLRRGALGPTERAIRSAVRPRVLGLITPLHCRPELDQQHITREFLDAVDGLVPRADVLFAIMGEYWWDEWPGSAYASWQPKMVRLDMAVDATAFPYVKTRFNPAGRRRFLYIGHNETRKGGFFLAALFARCPDLECAWIGNGPELPGIKRLSAARSLTPEFMAEIAGSYDVFLSPSLVDPNPTTILEAMAWGFPVVCTPQSGYYETDYRRNFLADDLARSEAVLRELQKAPDSQLVAMSRQARTVVQTKYTWEVFTQTVLGALRAEALKKAA